MVPLYRLILIQRHKSVPLYKMNLVHGSFRTKYHRFLWEHIFSSLWTALSVTRQTRFPGQEACYALQAVAKIADRLDIQSGNSPWWVAAAQRVFRFPAVTASYAFPFPLWPPNPEGATLLRCTDGLEDLRRAPDRFMSAMLLFRQDVLLVFLHC